MSGYLVGCFNPTPALPLTGLGYRGDTHLVVFNGVTDRVRVSDVALSPGAFFSARLSECYGPPAGLVGARERERARLQSPI